MTRLITDELDLLAELVPAPGPQVIELGCGAARMAQQMLKRWPGLRYMGLEVDAIQHARNLQDPPEGMRFVAAGAQDIPCGDGEFDLALMLKSLHHVPLTAMDQALAEVARVLRPGGRFLVIDTIAPEDEALDEFINYVEAIRDPSHAHDYRLSEWADTLGGLGLRYEFVKRWELPLEFDAWTKRMATPPEAVARLEALFDHATAEAVVAFRITPPPARSFCLHAAMFVGIKG